VGVSIALRLCRWWAVHEYAVGLEALIAAGEAEKRGEGITSREKSDNNNRQDWSVEAQLVFFSVEAGQYEVSTKRQRTFLWTTFSRTAATHPPSIIHDAAMAIKRQYHGVRSLSSGIASLMLW